MAGKKKAQVKQAGKKKAAAPRKKRAARATPQKSVAAPAERISWQPTNRSTVVAASAGIPPEGTINKVLVDATARLLILKVNKRSSDHASYPKISILKDAWEMLPGREDLEQFALKQAPITVRNFDWLQAITSEVELCEDDGISASMDHERVADDMTIAMRDVVDARVPLARRAASSGIPMSGFTLEGSYDDSFSLFSAGARCARLARARLDEFVGQDYTLGLIENFEASLAVLKRLNDRKMGLNKSDLHTMTRKQALIRMLFDCLTYVGQWGADISVGDPTREARYALDNIFPQEKKKAPPAAVTPPSTPVAAGGQG